MKFNVIMTSPTWSLSGVNTASTNLIRCFRENGLQAYFLLTNQDQHDPMPMPPPPDIPVEILPVDKNDTWKIRWDKLIHYLESKAPCIYIPGYDWEHSCISPKLSNQVGIVGVIHSDEPVHYDHAERLGIYWNSIVTVSRKIAEKAVASNQNFSNKIKVIPSGVSVPAFTKRNITTGAPLKIIYTGRIIEHQKRVFDLLKIAESLVEKNIPFKLTLIGGGPEEAELKKQCKPYIEKEIIQFIDTIPNDDVLKILEQNDVFILTSDFEGTPVSLLEAMAHGCIPVVTDIKSGIPELVINDINGYRIPVGNIQEFTDKLSRLYHDPELRQNMSREAYNKITNGGYSIEDVTQSYIRLFHKIFEEIKEKTYCRPEGEIYPPDFLQVNPDDLLSFQSQHAVNFIKKIEGFPFLIKLLSVSGNSINKIFHLINRKHEDVK